MESIIYIQLNSLFCVSAFNFCQVPEVLGILDLNVESILVGIMCSVLVLPVNLLWIFLFRYSRVSSPFVALTNRLHLMKVNMIFAVE